jgi:phosphohistidine phosphatase
VRRIRHISHISPVEAGCRNLSRMSDRTLVLLRHAKSAYPDGVADHERPLAPRGEREAGLAGDWLRTHLPAIDAVLCSTATRARETLARTGIDAPVRYVKRLYDATAGTVIDEINGVSGDVSVLLVVGHEPTMTEVALGLANPETTNADAAERISTKFPTSAMAVLRVNGSWTDLELGSAQLADFHVPR